MGMYNSGIIFARLPDLPSVAGSSSQKPHDALFPFGPVIPFAPGSRYTSNQVRVQH